MRQHGLLDLIAHGFCWCGRRIVSLGPDRLVCDGCYRTANRCTSARGCVKFAPIERCYYVEGLMTLDVPA